MSVNFEQAVNTEVLEKMREMNLGEVVAQDEKTTLLNNMNPMLQKKMGDLARLAKQPVTVEANGIGVTKVVRGVPYIMTAEGWKEQ